MQASRRAFLQAAAANLPLHAAGKPLNILYLHSHDTGRYLKPYGHATPTPNIQRLAAEGVLFRQAFSAALPAPRASRALTGQCPHQNGMLGLAHRGFAMTDYRRHMSHAARRCYRSILGGSAHRAQPETIGYDELLRAKSNRVADVAPAAARFLAGRPAEPSSSMLASSRPIALPRAHPDDDPRYIQPPAPMPDNPATRVDMAGFHASARILDQGVAQALDALELSGLAGNTLVISTTDHGLAFPDMKCNLLDSGFGVSLILRGPGLFRGGKVVDAMVSQLDLFPTLCDLIELKHPSWLEGKSMLPLLRDGAPQIHEEIFAEVNYHAAYEPKRAVRTPRWKYIRRYSEMNTPVLPNCDDGPSKSLWLEYGWRQQQLPREDLYDLMFDPNERHNLAGDAASAPTLADMRARMASWMKRTNDPLLKGPIPLPAGAVVNPSDGISPNEPTTGRRI